MLSETNSEPDWEYLPEPCLLMIMEKIDILSSGIQFSSVCKHWHSLFNAFMDYKRRSSANQIPLLLIPSKKSSTKGKLYSLQAKSKVCEIELPKLQTWRYCGSCFGWLATVSESRSITLSNPFKNVSSITLPPFDSEDFYLANYPFTVSKVVLSDDPLLYPDSYVVIIIYDSNNELAVYKSGHEDWIYINRDEFYITGLTDIIVHKSFVYAVGSNTLMSFDIGIVDDDTSKSPKLNILFESELIRKEDSDQGYLVKSSMGNLYSIHKYLDYEIGEEIVHSTKRFDVFKLILDEENGTLLDKKEVDHIDGDIVFVGDNKTLAVAVLDFPEGQPDSIYFTDDFFYDNSYKPFGPRDIGIFHLKDKSFGQYYKFKSSHKDLPPYIWISPPVDFKPTLSN